RRACGGRRDRRGADARMSRTYGPSSGDARRPLHLHEKRYFAATAGAPTAIRLTSIAPPVQPIFESGPLVNSSRYARATSESGPRCDAVTVYVLTRSAPGLI